MKSSSDYIKQEAQEIVGKTGLYVPPYRMANLMKTAQLITNLLAKADLSMTYKECLIVLDIVRNAVYAITGEDKE